MTSGVGSALSSRNAALARARRPALSASGEKTPGAARVSCNRSRSGRSVRARSRRRVSRAAWMAWGSAPGDMASDRSVSSGASSSSAVKAGSAD